MEKIKIVNKLKFKEKKDQDFTNYHVNLFVKRFINTDIYQKVEITKECIYLTKHNETGINHFTISGLQPKTNREMIIYITGVNYAV